MDICKFVSLNHDHKHPETRTEKSVKKIQCKRTKYIEKHQELKGSTKNGRHKFFKRKKKKINPSNEIMQRQAHIQNNPEQSPSRISQREHSMQVYVI